MLAGDWQSESHYFRFRENGEYSGGRKHSSLAVYGNWFLSDDSKLYLSGIIGDDSGETTSYMEIHNVIFNNNDTFELSDIHREYIRDPISWYDTE